MKELVSVIIPVYNVQEYLPACLDCVCGQTYKDLEIILVDDGSTDDSGAICEQYGQNDSRIRVIHKPNGGQSSARNMGIDVANGRWLTFVDSDDLIAPDYVEALLRAIGDCDISMCDRQKFTQAPDPVAGDGAVIVYDKDQMLRKVYDAPKYIAIWGKLYRRELFTSFRFAEGIIYEDEDALPQLFYASEKIACLQEEKYFYRVRPDSTMTATFSKKRLDIICVCKRRIDLFAQWGQTDLRKTAVKDYYRHLKRLEKQTAGPEWELEHELVLQELAGWPDYGVRFSLYERLKQLF